MRYDLPNRLTKGQNYGTPNTYSATAGDYGGQYGYNLNARYIHVEWSGNTLVTYPKIARDVHYLGPQSTPIQTPHYSQDGRNTTKGHGKIFNKETQQSLLVSYQSGKNSSPPRTEKTSTNTSSVKHNVTSEVDDSAQNGLTGNLAKHRA